VLKESEVVHRTGMKNPLVSIIVPVFKTPIPLLKRFLNSALGQSISQVELIAVDDASPDMCPQVLDAWSTKDARMTVIHRTENGRAGMARNDGLERARGSYVLFADADDILQPDMCETLYKLALDQEADIVACSYSIRNQNMDLVSRGHLSDCKLDLTVSLQRAMAYRNMNYALWNKIFRYKTIANLRFEQFEANIGEDTLFNVAALCQAKIFVTTTYCGYNFTIHNKSATGRVKKGVQYIRTLETSNDKIRKLISEKDGSVVGKRFAEHLSLKRFATGCAYIADYPQKKERDRLWSFWYCYFKERLMPKIETRILLAFWFRIMVSILNTPKIYRMMLIFVSLTEPLSVIQRLKMRLSSK